MCIRDSSEYFRLLIVAQGVRDAVQEAVISTVNDNYDDVYHGVRAVSYTHLTGGKKNSPSISARTAR